MTEDMEQMLKRQRESCVTRNMENNTADVIRRFEQAFEESRRLPTNPEQAPAAAPAPATVHRYRRAGIASRQTRTSQAPPSYSLESHRSRVDSERALVRQVRQMARACRTLLEQRLPLYQSQIQHLLDSPGDNEHQVATLFAQIEQGNQDLPVLAEVGTRPSLSVAEIHCVMRVLEDQYSQLRQEAEHGPSEADLILEDTDEVNNAEDGAGTGALASLLGFAALMGAASNNIGPDNGGGITNFARLLGIPANFFDNVPVPITDRGLQQMPVMTYASFKENLEGAEPNTQCNFCLDTFTDNDKIRCYPCCPRVAQHETCLEAWLRTHDTCIICKQKVGDFNAESGSNTNARTQ